MHKVEFIHKVDTEDSINETDNKISLYQKKIQLKLNNENIAPTKKGVCETPSNIHIKITIQFNSSGCCCIGDQGTEL